MVEDGAVGNGTIAAAKSRANSESLLAALRAEAAGYWRPAAAAADFGAGEQGALLERRLEPAYQHLRRAVNQKKAGENRINDSSKEQLKR